MSKDNIIIRGSKRGHHEEHGSHGAWKIAYADFMTALMAFFLMMWLTSSVSENIRKGISNYFAPIGVSSSVLGTDSILEGGESLEALGSLDNITQEQQIFPHTPTFNAPTKDQAAQPDKYDAAPLPEKKDFVSKEIIAKEQVIFEEAQKTLLATLKKDPALQKISNNILIEVTAEGLKIEIIDKDGTNMFAVGSKHMLDNMKLALLQISKVIQVLPNKITVTGHTDARPYGNAANYNNWDLSTDRALESRRFLVEAGFPEARISGVIGKASNELLNTADPLAPSNRRISILVSRNIPLPAEKAS